MVFPAAILIITVSLFMTSLTPCKAADRNCGFTARKRTSLSSAACRLSAAMRIPNDSSAFLFDSSVLSEPIILSGVMFPFERRPPMIAVAILPSPINPICIFCLFPYLFILSAACVPHTSRQPKQWPRLRIPLFLPWESLRNCSPERPSLPSIRFLRFQLKMRCLL